jgi:hypothetical protein
MRVPHKLKEWLGVLSRPRPLQTMSREVKTDPPASEQADAIMRVHAALDAVYGKGWSKANPDAVAQFMQAISLQLLAGELAALREIIGSGTGAITVGLEKPPA